MIMNGLVTARLPFQKPDRNELIRSPEEVALQTPAGSKKNE